jgi:hypothetical protein
MRHELAHALVSHAAVHAGIDVTVPGTSKLGEVVPVLDHVIGLLPNHIHKEVVPMLPEPLALFLRLHAEARVLAT